MKIIFATESIKYPLTGIGRYSFELVKRLAVASDIEELKLFHGTTFIEKFPRYKINGITNLAIIIAFQLFTPPVSVN